MILKKRNITEVIPLTLHRIFDTFLPADFFHYGVPLGPLAISRVLIWKLQTCLKFRPFRKREARDRELSHSLSHSRSLALALSLSRASRFLKPVNFRHLWGFHVKFLNKKARLEIASGPNGTPYLTDEPILIWWVLPERYNYI